MKEIIIYFLISGLTFMLACGHKRTPPEPQDLTPLMEKKVQPRTDTIRKELIYTQYTLEDHYFYKETPRQFQWKKIQGCLDTFDLHQKEMVCWGILQNNKNINGVAPLVANARKDNYGSIVDSFGVTRNKSIPLYDSTDLEVPKRYARDGSLVKLTIDSTEFVKVTSIFFEGEWVVPQKYVKPIGYVTFKKAIFIDRTNQNITTLEKDSSRWLVRSMNPATTGLHHPPYKRETPLGIFVIQDRIPKMLYYRDGTTEIGGSAPYANRFSDGAFIHGVPVDLPRRQIVEWSPTLGTTPRSHMCVRNATSHALFIYHWAPLEETVVFVIE